MPHSKVCENRSLFGLDGLPVLRSNVSVNAKDLPYIKMGSQQMTALATAWIQADFQCPIEGCNHDLLEVHQGISTDRKLRVVPSARVISPRMPQDEAGNSYRVGIWSGA